jgi:hypothetical protein
MAQDMKSDKKVKEICRSFRRKLKIQKAPPEENH